MFTGSWTVEASDAVGTVDGDLDAVDTLASLLAQSLFLIDESDAAEPRFRMLNTIRAYARGQLAERGEADATILRLTRYLVRFVETVPDALQGPDHRAVTERLDLERDEIQRLDDAAGAFRELDDRWGLALTLSTRGQLALLAGDARGGPSRRPGDR